MGRPRTRYYLDEARQISIKALRGYLAPGAWCRCSWGRGSSVGVSVAEDAITLIYTADGGGQSTEHRVRVDLEKAPRRLGGHQIYFRCPRCSRRAQKLYGIGRDFICRHCAGRPYRSQSRDAIGRAEARHLHHQRKLQPTGELNFGEVPPRPKWMQHSTYERIKKACLGAYWLREELLAPGLERIMERIEQLEAAPSPTKGRYRQFWG